MSSFSSVGKARVAAYLVVLACTLIVFALAAHVNSFHGFFYVADQFPFVMSILTFLIIGIVLINDFRSSDPTLSKPVVELVWLGLLNVFWLALNAFSSSRWRYIQAADCTSIPGGDDFARVATWCKEVQALRTFVWLEWLVLFVVFVWLLRFTVSHAAHGNRHVWGTSLAYYSPDGARGARGPAMHYISRPTEVLSGSAFMPTQSPRFAHEQTAPQYGTQQPEAYDPAAYAKQQRAAYANQQQYDYHPGHAQ